MTLGAIQGRVMVSAALAMLAGCHLFAAQPPCQSDHNCLTDQVCDTNTNSCVPRPEPDSGGVVADSGDADAVVLDASRTDAADASRTDLAPADVSPADQIVGDSATPDIAADSGAVDGARDDATPLDDAAMDDATALDGAADAAADDATAFDAAADSGGGDWTDAAPSDARTGDTAVGDAEASDLTLPDLLAFDTGGWERLCDDRDDDGDGLIDERCDDDGDGYFDHNLLVIGSPAVCPNSAPGMADDCDDTMPTCNTDCTTNSDGDFPPVLDCVEEYCGSDPMDPLSRCRIVSSRSSTDNAIDAVNNEDGIPDYILLRSMRHEDGFETITSDDGLTIRQWPGERLTIDSHPHEQVVFDVEGDNVTIDGVHMVNVQNARIWVEFHGASGTLRHSILDGYEQRGVSVSGAANTLIQDNVIIDGDGDNDDGHAAIVVNYAVDTVIVGNVLAQDEAGVHVAFAEGVRLDHNTIANVLYDALRFYGFASTGVCMRNNIVAGCRDVIDFEVDVTWDESAGCVGPLDTSGGAGPKYGNDAFGFLGLCYDLCNGTTEAECAACLPAGAAALWELETNPLFTSSTHGDVGFYCPEATALIDAADILSTIDPAYDRNGTQPGQYNGAAPEIGARETGTPECAP